MIKKIAFVGHRVSDMSRARRFYGELLGLKPGPSYEDSWCEFDTPDGTTIALEMFSDEGSPPMLALETDDIEAELARLEEAGVAVKMPLRDNEVCKMAIVDDGEGNAVMLHQIAPHRATD